MGSTFTCVRVCAPRTPPSSCPSSHEVIVTPRLTLCALSRISPDARCTSLPAISLPLPSKPALSLFSPGVLSVQAEASHFLPLSEEDTPSSRLPNPPLGRHRSIPAGRVPRFQGEWDVSAEPFPRKPRGPQKKATCRGGVAPRLLCAWPRGWVRPTLLWLQGRWAGSAAGASLQPDRNRPVSPGGQSCTLVLSTHRLLL